MLRNQTMQKQSSFLDIEAEQSLITLYQIVFQYRKMMNRTQTYNINLSKMTDKIYTSSIVQVYDATTHQIKGLNSNIQGNENPDGNPQLAQQTLTQSSKKMLYIIMGLVTSAIVIAVVLGVTLSLFLKKNQPGIQPAPQPQPSPSPPRNYSCSDFSAGCVGVLESVQNYIFQNSHDADQIQAQLQLSRSLSGIQDNTRLNLTDTYQELMKSVECLAYNMPDSYSKAYSDIIQLQLTTEESLINYFNMTFSFSGQPITLTPAAQVPSLCQFNLTRRLRRYLQSGSGCPERNATVILIYTDGNGMSPIINFRYLQKIKEFTTQNYPVNFDGGAVLIGSERKDGLTSFFLDVITSFQNDQQANNQAVPSRLSLLWCLRVFIDYDLSITTLPASIPDDLIFNFYEYFTLKITQSMNNIGTNYNIYNFQQFVSLQMVEGKKVVLLAHADGAILANAVYNALTTSQKSSIGLVYTSPYSANMADGLSNYVSNVADGVLNRLIYRSSDFSIATPLVTNAEPKLFNRSIDLGSNHDFIGYLVYYKDQLSYLVADAKRRPIQPLVNTNLIKVQLVWSGPVVLDLHVYQPNNTHIYWYHSQGIGTLWRAFYPPPYYQNYTVGCQNMVPGVFTVGVNFSWGNVPAQFTVNVYAGTVFFTHQMTRTTVTDGIAGDNNPTYVCNITATLNPTTNLFSFQVVR